jgi:hypothetical protein
VSDDLLPGEWVKLRGAQSPITQMKIIAFRAPLVDLAWHDTRGVLQFVSLPQQCLERYAPRTFA